MIILSGNDKMGLCITKRYCHLNCKRFNFVEAVETDTDRVTALNVALQMAIWRILVRAISQAVSSRTGE
jgi:hypothetical protein